MTLILSQVSYEFVLQVSDRLITQDREPVEFDPVSNKSILYQAPDAIVSMSYTGIAYLDGRPTDQWFAELISGSSMPPGPHPDSPTMACLGTMPQWLHIGPTIRLITERLTNAFALRHMRRQARRTPFEILIAGWQWSLRKRPRPVVVSIAKKRSCAEFKIWRSQRHLGPEALCVATPDGQLKTSERDSMCDEMRNTRSADEAESVFIKTIRSTSRRSNLVGPDCMSILIPPPAVGKVRVRYIAHKPRNLALVSRSPPKVLGTLPATFTPWVIGRDLMYAPSLIGGGGRAGLGPFEVVFEGPAVPADAGKTTGPRLIDAAGGLKRPREPR